MSEDLEVESTDDAALALDATRSFLASRPVDHNLAATTLRDMAPFPGVGRYWWVSDHEGVRLVAVQAPKGSRLAVTPAAASVTDALVDEIAATDPTQSGVFAEAATAAKLAGRFAERLRVPVTAEGGRLYRLGTLVPPPEVAGRMRRATETDEDLVITWSRAFAAEGGEDDDDRSAEARHRIAQGRLWLWETDRPVAMAGAPEAANGVARLGWVYTPREHRRRGFAGAVTAALSGQLLAHEADTCVLYTQLSNPTSNAIYLRLGYRPVSETLTYRFGETL